MITNPYLLISILLNTFIAFYSAAFVVELIILGFFKTKSRIRATLRILPFIVVISDRFFGGLRLINWLNPLSCKSCLQSLLLYFTPELKDATNVTGISLINLFNQKNPVILIHYLSSFFCLLTALFIISKVIKLVRETETVSLLIKLGTPCLRPIYNVKLKCVLAKEKVQLIESPSLICPLAAFATHIIIPEKMVQEISQEEYESIIAHELEHIRYKDSWVRVTLEAIRTLFWWIPTQRWTELIIEEQELAADQNTSHYNIEPTTLASALIKASKFSKNYKTKLICSLHDTRKSTLGRLNRLLGSNLTTYPYLKWALFGLASEALILIGCSI